MNSAVHISNMHNAASVMSLTGRCAIRRAVRNNWVSNPDPLFLDRIDIQIDIIPLSFEEVSKTTKAESSEEIRKRVVAARAIQQERFKDHPLIHSNSQMTPAMLREFCVLDDKSLSLIQKAMTKLDLSARAYDRILKVARTIADYEGSVNITSAHVAEAISYRNLDRSSWGQG